MVNIELHLFTNCFPHSPNTSVIERTYKSFSSRLNVDLTPTLWIDSNPHHERYDQYVENLKEVFPNAIIHKTKSLSDGYVKAVKNSNSEFMLMVEHDFEFINNISNSLDEITTMMERLGLIHLRFNKRNNVVKGWDKRLKEQNVNVNGKNVSCCLTCQMSNNPHIINRNLYINEALKYVKIESEGAGIEQNLYYCDDDRDLKSAIYGKLNAEPTIQHIAENNTRRTVRNLGNGITGKVNNIG